MRCFDCCKQAGAAWLPAWGPLSPAVVAACCACGKPATGGKGGATAAPNTPDASAPVRGPVCARGDQCYLLRMQNQPGCTQGFTMHGLWAQASPAPLVGASVSVIDAARPQRVRTSGGGLSLNPCLLLLL